MSYIDDRRIDELTKVIKDLEDAVRRGFAGTWERMENNRILTTSSLQTVGYITDSDMAALLDEMKVAREMAIKDLKDLMDNPPTYEVDGSINYSLMGETIANIELSLIGAAYSSETESAFRKAWDMEVNK